MTWTYTPSTDIGRCRRTMPDRDPANVVFTDEEWQSFLADEGDWRRATALALETYGSDLNLVLRVTRAADGSSVDATKAAAEARARAKELRAQANEADAASGALFDTAELNLNEWTARDILTNAVLRDSA